MVLTETQLSFNFFQMVQNASEMSKIRRRVNTIGKMPCDQFDEAENVLNDMKQRFCP